MTLCFGSGCMTDIIPGRELCHFHRLHRPAVVAVLEISLGRLVCGRSMKHVRDTCARRPGHRFACRSLYALENARAFGRTAA